MSENKLEETSIVKLIRREKDKNKRCHSHVDSYLGIVFALLLDIEGEPTRKQSVWFRIQCQSNMLQTKSPQTL